MNDPEFFFQYQDYYNSHPDAPERKTMTQPFFLELDNIDNSKHEINFLITDTNQTDSMNDYTDSNQKLESHQSHFDDKTCYFKIVEENKQLPQMPLKINVKQEFTPTIMNIKKMETKIPLNYIYTFSKDFVDISGYMNLSLYDIIYNITGAYLNHQEIIYVRKNIFGFIFPPITRDEIRSKKKNIFTFNKYKEKVFPYLQNPQIQFALRNYLINRRRDHEKREMLEKFTFQHHKT